MSFFLYRRAHSEINPCNSRLNAESCSSSVYMSHCSRCYSYHRRYRYPYHYPCHSHNHSLYRRVSITSHSDLCTIYSRNCLMSLNALILSSAPPMCVETVALLIFSSVCILFDFCIVFRFYGHSTNVFFWCADTDSHVKRAELTERLVLYVPQCRGPFTQ